MMKLMRYQFLGKGKNDFTVLWYGLSKLILGHLKGQGLP